MHHRLSTFALACALVIPVVAKAQDWVEYRPKGIGFHIAMPAEPKIEEKKSKTGFYSQAFTVFGNSVFLVIYSDKREDKSNNPDRLLDAVVKSQSAGKAVLADQKEKVDGHPARRVTLRNPDSTELELRDVIFDSRLVEVIFTGPRGDLRGKRFLDSLGFAGP